MSSVFVVEGRLTRSTSLSAGWDLYSTEDKTLFSGQFTLVNTGVFTEMDKCYGLIFDKSGLAASMITTRGGVIDSDYRDEWKVILVNEGLKPYFVHCGQKIAQVIFNPTPDVEVRGYGVEIIDRNRIGGFGSTGL